MLKPNYGLSNVENEHMLAQGSLDLSSWHMEVHLQARLKKAIVMEDEPNANFIQECRGLKNRVTAITVHWTELAV